MTATKPLPKVNPKDAMEADMPIFMSMGPVPTYKEPTPRQMSNAKRARFRKDQDAIFDAVAAELKLEREANALISLTAAYRIVAGFEREPDGRMTVVCPVCQEAFRPITDAGDVALVIHRADDGHTINYTKAWSAPNLCPHHNQVAQWGDDEGMCTMCGMRLPRDPETGEGSRVVIDTQHGKIFGEPGDLEAIRDRFNAPTPPSGTPMPDVMHGLRVWKASTIMLPENRGASVVALRPSFWTPDPDEVEVTGAGVPGDVATLVDSPHPTIRLDRDALVRQIAADQEARATGEQPRIVA